MTADSPLAITIYIMLGISAYAFFVLCIHRMAVDAGLPRAWFAYVPVLNLYTTCRLAGRGWLWTVLLFVPAINILLFILICLRLAKSRGRRWWFGVLLMLPVTDLFALWVLAFTEKEPEPEPEVGQA